LKNLKKQKPCLKDRICYGGLDLSTTTDITAFVKVFPPMEKDELTKVLCRFWMPKNKIDDLRHTGIPYDVWVRQGFIKATPGNVVDYSVVREDIKKDYYQYLLKEIAFDRWNATDISQELSKEGIMMIQMGQGYASLSGPSKELEGLVLDSKINHGGNPVLRWMIDCVTVTQDAAANIKPVKPDRRETSNRIDGVVALIMALDRTFRGESAAPEIVNL